MARLIEGAVVLCYLSIIIRFIMLPLKHPMFITGIKSIITKSHRSDIRVITEEEKGTTFIFTLPFKMN